MFNSYFGLKYKNFGFFFFFFGCQANLETMFFICVGLKLLSLDKVFFSTVLVFHEVPI